MQRRTLLGTALAVGTIGAGLGITSPANAVTTLAIDSLSGDITSNELTSFTTWMNEVVPETTNVNNTYVYINTAHTSWALHLMYGLTGQVNILDRLIVFCDTMLLHRNDHMGNDNEGPVVMWTGQVEPVWRNKAFTAADVGYFGAETGHTAGLLARAAQAVYTHSALWNAAVPDGDPNGYGQTYRQRADHYLAACDETLDVVIANFINPTTLRCHVPDTDAYGNLGTSYENNRGLPMPWNIQAFLAQGLTASAECHELLGDDATRVTKYDAIVAAYLDWFRSTLVETNDDDGTPTYRWGYYAGRTNADDTGHGDLDAFGAYLGLVRGLGGITASIVERMADNWVHSINMGGNQFTLYIDGTGGYDRNYLRNYCLMLCCQNADLYHVVADAFVANRASVSGVGLVGSIWATIMWAKRNRYLGNFPT